jgi:hypothetical protein
MTGSGQFERFTPSKLSDRNEFVEETFAGTAAADSQAPIATVAGFVEWKFHSGLTPPTAGPGGGGAWTDTGVPSDQPAPTSPPNFARSPRAASSASTGGGEDGHEPLLWNSL